MGMFSNDEREEILDNLETERKLRERVGELEVENLHKQDTIEKLQKELKDIRKKRDTLKTMIEYQSKVISETLGTVSDSEINKSISLKKYTERQRRIFDNKVKHNFNTTNIYQEARYILEEVAELMRAIEKNDRENMIEELADIVIFAYGCTEVARLGDLDTKIFEKMTINENREYKQNSEGDFVKTGGTLND